MTAMTEFTLGARASCTDGFCGHVRRAIVDPATLTVTHLVIEPRHHRHAGSRLVPAELAETSGGEVRLRCTLEEFGRLSPAEEVDLVADDYGGGYGEAESVQGYGGGLGGGVSGMGIGAGLGHQAPILIRHAIPLGEAEVERNDRVHATDGEIGQVEGFVVDPATRKVTHVLLQEGHLWGRKEVAIPVSAVASADAGIRLNLTKKQVEELPPAGPAGQEPAG
jgi:hypothetical protein